MLRLELTGGAYATRSVLGSSQKCINVFAEKPRKDGQDTWTHYQRGGLRQLVVPPRVGPGRGVFRSTQGFGYCVVGQNVYSVSPAWTLTQIGSLATPGTTVCSMADNGIQALLVDGGVVGYKLNVVDGSGFAPVIDPTGIFGGSVKVDYLDTFTLWAVPNSQQFGSTYSNELVFDPTWTAAKTGYPDLLQTLYVNRHEILLIGQVKSEIWYDAGGQFFPFALLPGAYIEWGAIAPRSVASSDVNVYWLGQGTQGTGLVIRQRGYETHVVSNYAISYAIGQMLAKGVDISDAVAYTYTRDGHIFYVLTFISGDQTWVYDESVGDPEYAWHQRGYMDANGVLHRERVISAAWLNGVNVGQDWQNGTLYAIDPDYYFDYVDDGDGQGAFARPISYTRTFSQLKYADGPNPLFPMPLNGRSITIHEFMADFDCGNADPDLFGDQARIAFRVSWDRGRTFSNFVMQSAGALGQYYAVPKWGNIGQGKWPVMELNWSTPAQAALNGGFVRATVREN